MLCGSTYLFCCLDLCHCVCDHCRVFLKLGNNKSFLKTCIVHCVSGRFKNDGSFQKMLQVRGKTHSLSQHLTEFSICDIGRNFFESGKQRAIISITWMFSRSHSEVFARANGIGKNIYFENCQTWNKIPSAFRLTCCLLCKDLVLVDNMFHLDKHFVCWMQLCTLRKTVPVGQK